jgi:tol-pal system protein YbgF
MFRHSILACAHLGLTLGLAIAAAPMPAWGQDSSTQERLDRLERDLNMLQRQVYRGAPAPLAGVDPNMAVGTEIRMDRIETQMRDLTGRVEELMNQIERLHQRVEQINGDVDTRLGQASPGPGAAFGAAPWPPGPANAPRQPPAGAASPAGLPSSGPIARGAVVPPPTFGTLTPPGTPPAAPEAVGMAGPAPGMALPSGSATEQYNYAFGLLQKPDYPGAEAALRAFVEQHPKDTMAGNAQYWLGETYFARNKFIEAASAFAEGYKRYPKGAKAPDTLLKLGLSLGRADQKQNACVALAQLDREFPNPGAPIKERAAAEKKRLHC